MVLNEAGPAGPPRFTIGGVIATSCVVLFSNVSRFLPIFLAIAVPAGGLLMLGGFAFAMLGDAVGVSFDFMMWLTDPATLLMIAYGVVVFVIGYALVLGAVTHGALQALRGEPVGIGAALGQAFSALPRLFVAVLIFSVMLGLIVSSMGWVAFRAMLRLDTDGDASGIAWLIVAVVAALVLMALVLVVTWVFVPVVMVERAGPIECFRRSLALTKGRRWSVFALVVLTALANWLLSAITEVIQGLGVEIAGELLDFAFTSFLVVLSAVLSAVGYARFRGEKEGVVGEDVVKVFD